jgi:hypothetical protein
MLVTEDSNKSQKPGKLHRTRDVGQRIRRSFFRMRAGRKDWGKRKNEEQNIL